MFSKCGMIESQHRDLIHDVSFDIYGIRMATCSSDQTIKVFDFDDKVWKLTSSWKAHSGSVWKVNWAHPEFGQVLASCSFDRTAAVWEEITETQNRHWAKRTTLVDSRTSVMDVKFAPKSLGLILATCSVDGVVRIYEAPDVMNLAQWTLQQEVATTRQSSCLSFNPTYKENDSEFFPALAIGSDEQNSNNLLILHLASTRKWSRIDTNLIIADPIHDISFAPRFGRTYDLLALASKDVKILTLHHNATATGVARFDLALTAAFDVSPWRISWNSLGSLLAATGDDSTLNVFKQYQKNIWKPIKFK